MLYVGDDFYFLSHNLWTNNFHDRIFFLAPKGFGPKRFFGPKNFFRPKMFLDSKHFLTKYFLTQYLLWRRKKIGYWFQNQIDNWCNIALKNRVWLWRWPNFLYLLCLFTLVNFPLGYPLELVTIEKKWRTAAHTAI